MPIPLPVPSAPVLLEMVPPVQVAAEVHVPPLPETVRPPVPALSSTMPLALPLSFEVILRNSNLFAPMVVLTTLSAVPVVVVSVLTNAPVAAELHGFSSQTLTVPPPVAVKAAFAEVESVRPPEKVIVALLLVVSDTPVLGPPLSEIAPENAYVGLPPVTFWIWTSLTLGSVI